MNETATATQTKPETTMELPWIKVGQGPIPGTEVFKRKVKGGWHLCTIARGHNHGSLHCDAVTAISTTFVPDERCA